MDQWLFLTQKPEWPLVHRPLFFHLYLHSHSDFTQSHGFKCLKFLCISLALISNSQSIFRFVYPTVFPKISLEWLIDISKLLYQLDLIHLLPLQKCFCSYIPPSQFQSMLRPKKAVVALSLTYLRLTYYLQSISHDISSTFKIKCKPNHLSLFITTTLVLATTLSCLDHCTSLRAGLLSSIFEPLLSILHKASRVIFFNTQVKLCLAPVYFLLLHGENILYHSPFISG